MAYLLIPLDDAIVFPGVSATLPIDTGEEEQVFLLPRSDGEFGRVGVVAEVIERGHARGGTPAATVVGLHRGLAGAAVPSDEGEAEALRIDVQEVHDGHPDDEHTQELAREYRAVVEEILELRGADDRIAAFLRSVEEPGALADTTGLSPDVSNEQKLRLLEAIDVTARLQLAVELQRERLAELQVRSRIRDDVESGAQKQQRDYFLRKQMESIRKELGEDEGSLIEEYERKIAEAGMPEAVAEQAEKELRRLERQGEQSPESSMIRSYLDWLIAVPWSSAPRSGSTPRTRARCSTPTTPGWRTSSGGSPSSSPCASCARSAASTTTSRANGAILTLVGPPGTGKTSIGESIARALGREFVRISLGGLHDEAEIRGHRRTYIGALPGRIVRALRDAGTMNPVILLDEVDKVGADWRGDPSAALLEVLDPAQNHSFRDHYLDVEVDLSEVVFLATANMTDTIPAPLLDRMETIAFDGYTSEEKLAIARGYLLPRQLKRNGLRAEEVEVGDELLRSGDLRVHPRGGRAPARARAGQAAARRGDADRLRRGRGADRARHRGIARLAGAPALLPGVGRAHRDPRRLDRARRHRRPVATSSSSRRPRWRATRAWS